MAAITLDKNFKLDIGFRVQIYRVQLDVDRLIIVTRAVTNTLIVATNNVSTMTKSKLGKWEIIDSQI